MSNLDSSLSNFAKQSLIFLFESIDKGFSNSNERKSKYFIKSHMSHSIMTVFGQITFKRTFYESKVGGSSYCYLDRLFVLHKYDYFDPYIKTLIIHYSADNFFSKTASIINDLIGNRICLDEKFQFLNRQTVRNIVLNKPISEPFLKQKNVPNTLYVLADENGFQHKITIKKK